MTLLNASHLLFDLTSRFNAFSFLQISNLIDKNFTSIHNEVVKKSDTIDGVRARVEKLIADTKNLYLKALAKITEAEGTLSTCN